MKQTLVALKEFILTILGVGQRLREIRGEVPLKSFSERLKVHKNTLARYEREESYPDASFLHFYCREFGISPAWLLFGEGPTYMAEIKAYFLKQEYGDETGVPENDDLLFREVIRMVDSALNSKHYREETISPEMRAKTYFYLHTKCEEDRSISPMRVAESISKVIKPSFCIHDLDISLKIKELVEFKECNLSEPSANNLYWKIKDYLIDNYMDLKTIAPNGVKIDVLRWIDKELTNIKLNKELTDIPTSNSSWF